MFIFSEYDIRMRLYVFWLRKGLSVKYVRNWCGDGGNLKCVQGEEGVTPHVYIRTYTITIS